MQTPDLVDFEMLYDIEIMYLHYLQNFQLPKLCFQGISFLCPYAIPDHMCILIAIVFNNWSYAFSDPPTIVLYFQDKCALWRFL